MKKLRAIFVFISMLNMMQVFGQVNLISNGSFEQCKKFPPNLLSSIDISFYTNNWNAPLIGVTPDYYNFYNPIGQIRDPYLVFAPGFLFQRADSVRIKVVSLSGKSFIGISNEYTNSATSNFKNNYFTECIATSLLIKLKKNYKYRGGFFYNNAGFQSLIVSDIGMIFTEDTSKLNVAYNGYWVPTYYNNYPQVINKEGLIKSKNEWHSVNSVFKSKGTEKQAVISYFKNEGSKEELDSSNADLDFTNSTFRFRNYFFIDSVTLYEIPCLVAQDTACKGDSVHFYHTFSGNTIWTTSSDSTQGIVGTDSVYSFVANQSGWYYVFTSTGKDSTYLTVIESPTVTLGEDTFFCEKSNVILTATGTNMQGYQWQDGAASTNYTANKQGWYWLKVSNAGCSIIDSVYVTQHPLPDKFSKHQFSICAINQQYATLDLNPEFTYHWQTLSDSLNKIYFTKEGCESVTILSQYGCITADEVCVEDICSAKVFMPNAFTPNGANPVLKPITKYISAIRWEIYNRWGERIFETADPTISWDGTSDGQLEEVGVYFYRIQYTSSVDGKEYVLTGNVTLLR